MPLETRRNGLARFQLLAPNGRFLRPLDDRHLFPGKRPTDLGQFETRSQQALGV